MRVIFMGTPDYAKVILNELIKAEDIGVVATFTQPDRPFGRKKVLTPPPVKELSLKHNIEIYQPESLKDETFYKIIRDLNPDFIVVAAYGQLLPKEILDIAPCINLHASILPKYRGASPIQQAILNQDEYSGVTAMLMEEGLDSGDMLGFRFIKTAQAPNLYDMTNMLSNLAAKLTLSILREFDNIEPIPQFDALSTKCKKIKKSDGLVDFSDANILYAKSCAFFGWPGVFLESGLKLLDIELIDSVTTNNAGEILDIFDDSVTIGCTLGAIKVATLQPPSKAKMSAKAYIMGKRITIGDTLFW